MTDELTDARLAEMLAKYANGLTGLRCAKASDEAAKDVPALVAALRSAKARPKYSGDWEEAEIALRDVLDADDALEVLQTLQGLGFASAAELERERTQNLRMREVLEMGLHAGAHSPACAVRRTPHPCDCGRDPFVVAARAALSTQEAAENDGKHATK